MKRQIAWWILNGTIGLFAATLNSLAQDKPKPHVQIPVIAARPEDVSSPEAIVKADYESISGGVGVPRQWARDLSLYNPNARSFSVDKDPKTGALVIWSPTLNEYADEADAHLVSEGFTETEVAHKIHRFGNVATVFSSYEGKFASTGKLYTRGVNTYQLYYDGKRWWISSVTWDSENYISPIPPELLPQSDSATTPEVGSNAQELVRTTANPGDVNTLESIIDASYEALSGPVGTPRQWERYRSLLDPQVRLVSASMDSTTGQPKIVRWNREEYAASADDYLVKTGFVDRKLGCTTSQYGNVAAVRCGFEGLEQSKLVERGVAIYQLYNDGKRWWITSVVWDQERPGNPLPAELLTRK